MKFIVEHMEPELGEWAQLEYEHMLKWVGPGNLILSHLDENLLPQMPESLLQNAVCTTETVQTLPIDQSKILLLDPAATEELKPEDGDNFDYLLFGGILGDDPPQDRTRLLRKLGFATRHLGPTQLPTDHAVIFAKKIADEQIPLDKVPMVIFPTVQLGKKEFVELPFGYLADEEGRPCLAPGMLDLLKRTNDEPLI